LTAALAAAPLAAQTRPDHPVKRAPQRTTAAITAADLMSRLYVFADDSMLGREAGSIGNVKGTEYIVRELTRLGVKPAGENGGYYQNVPLVTEGFNTDSTVMRIGATALTPRTDFFAMPGVLGLPFAGSANVTDAPVVFGGRLGAADAIKPEATAGKLVLMLPPMGPNGQAAYQVWVAADQIGSYKGAAGVLVVSLEITPPQVFPLFSQTSMGLEKPASTGVSLVVVSKAVANQLLGASIESAAIGTVGTAKASLRYAPVKRAPDAPTRNVLAMVEGSDPTLKAEVIALSAHSDHVGFVRNAIDHDSARFAHLIARPMGVETPGRALTAEEQARVNAQRDSVRKLRPMRPDSIFNGADDDGSGSMGLLELAEYFQTLPTKPKRSILFAWVVAEEKGLFGSEWFGESPTIPRERIVANVNIDMIGRGASWDIPTGSPDYLQLLGATRLSTEYGAWVTEMNNRPEFGFKLDYQFDAEGHPQQYYCRSDHYNFARWGIPTVFFSTGSHVDYHMVTDEPQYIDYPHYEKVVRFVGAFATDVANRAAKPVVDKAKPDPYGTCRQ
jgi:Zn-dependent M28 family amino/carboxypeptidase